MSSTIHKILFSPPPSPHDAPYDPNSPFTPLGELLSPVLDSVSPPSGSGTPKAAGSAASPSSSLAVDVEAAIPNGPNMPTFHGKQSSRRFAPPMLSLSPRLMAGVGNRIPRPVLRFVAFVCLATSCLMLMSSVASAIAGPVSPQRYAPPPERFVPPHVQAKAIRDARRVVAANPRASRPNPHPIPATHELIALQDFILETPYARLPSSLDTTKPLDAVNLLGAPASRRLGETGSEREQEWLDTVRANHLNSVVLWYATRAVPHYALEGVGARHGQGRRPTHIATVNRPDAAVIHAIFARLGHDLEQAPVLVIGGEIIDATPETMDELRSSGKLAEQLSKIGWTK